MIEKRISGLRLRPPNPYPGLFLSDTAEFVYAVDCAIECGEKWLEVSLRLMMDFY